MPLNPDEIIALTGTDFVTQVPNVKYRQHGSVLGIIKMYQDRFEWHDPGVSEPIVVIPYETVSELRVSAPDKPKVQIQAVLTDQEHVNFHIAESGKSKDELLDLQKKTRAELQNLIVRHRKILKTHEQRMSNATMHELDSKRKLLKTSWFLKVMYNSLVMTNVMSPEDFWKMYYKPHEVIHEQPGVSNGFLFDIDIGPTGAVNLSQEVRRQIYKTYPSIEKKYIEYVPNTMSEQDFWAKFIQSHYFYRDRNPEYKKNDPISDCIQEDEEQLNQNAKRLLHYKKDKDLLNILEDDGLYADRPELFNPVLSDKKKLIRRLNDFSDRVLEAALDPQRNNIIDSKSEKNKPTPMEVDFVQNEDEPIVEDDFSLTYYVKKPGVPESGTSAEKIKESVLPEDLEYSDQELELIDQEGKESDEELDFRPVVYGRDVHSRFIKLKIPSEMFKEVCEEIIERSEGIEVEDDFDLEYEDAKIAMDMTYPFDPEKKEETLPIIPLHILRKLFSANIVVLELSQQARKLISKKTIYSSKQAIAICSALTTFQNTTIAELKETCRDESRGATKFIEYLQVLIDSVLSKATELRDSIGS
ncbi:hypothetical protein FO519_002456 [Halicephalobus sp. NKZ332]|nr:hypothetical protein FO519_002456 [Halicephalobus sp. NKZ332]